MLQSAGGDLVDRDSFITADGALNGPEAVEFFEWFQSTFDRGLTSDAGTIGNEEFNNDEVALSYTGIWNALDSVEAVGDDLLILPPPDFGNGPKIGGASWQWGISASCDAADGAREYLEFSFKPEYVAAFADGQAVIPATAEAEALATNFGDGGPADALRRAVAEVRPRASRRRRPTR